MYNKSFLEIVEQGIYKATLSSAIFDYKIVKENDTSYKLYATDYVTDYAVYEELLENHSRDSIAKILEGIGESHCHKPKSVEDL